MMGEEHQLPTPAAAAAAAVTLESLAWLQKIHEHGKSTDNESLFSYFRGHTKKDDLTLPVINLVTSCCKAVFGSTSSSSSGGSSDPAAAAAQLDPSACATYLYYMVIEGLLQQLFPRDAQQAASAQPQRFKGMIKVQNPPACTQLVSCQEFHLPHIECALHLVHCISTPQAGAQLLHVSQVLERQDMAALLWQAARNFLECFGPSSPFPMPQQLQQQLTHLQEVLLQQAVFSTGSALFEVMTAGGGCQYQPGDMSLAHNITAAYAEQAIQRTQLVAWRLQQAQGSSSSSSSSTGLNASFHEQCAWLMDKVLLNHLHLCFGTHMAVMAACVVYVTAKLTQAPLSFSTITQVICSIPGWTPEVLSRSELCAQPLSHGDLRAFYNTRFLPAVQGSVRTYLQQYSSLSTEQHTAMPAATAPAKSVGDTETQAPASQPNSSNSLLVASLPPAAATGPPRRVRFSAIMPQQQQQQQQAMTAAGKAAGVYSSDPAAGQHAAAWEKENATGGVPTGAAGVVGSAARALPATLLGLPLGAGHDERRSRQLQGGGALHPPVSPMVMR